MYEHRGEIIKTALSAALLITAYMLCRLIAPAWYIALIFYLVPYFIISYDVLLECVNNILHGKIFDEAFLMSVATVGALLLGDYPEAVLVMMFYRLGELFEDTAIEKSKRSIIELMDIRPQTARVIRNGAESLEKPESIKIGELVAVRAGERIPLDGEITSGCVNVDTSMLTGEAMPRALTVGDKALSGFIVLDGVIEIKVEKPYGESTVAKILQLVEESEASRAKSERFINRFAEIYTPAVVAIALLVGVVPPLFSGEWLIWLKRGLIMLVISCPCALVLSIPLTFFASIGSGASEGVLIKGSELVEKLAGLKRIAFDKTGTLTSGRLEIVKISGERDTLKKLASVEKASNHPIATAICKAYDGELLPIERVFEHSGMGIEAYSGASQYLAGNRALMDRFKVEVPPCENGATSVFLAENGELCGYALIGDTVKANAADAVTELKGCGVTRTIMLTGDTRATAESVCATLGIDGFEAELLPQDKLKCLDEFSNGEVCAFVGDGINDAPVLKRAGVGIAMGGIGSDASIEAADVVLMNDDISKLPFAVKHAKRTMRIVWENIVFALFVKATVMALCGIGIASMGSAVFADVGVMIICVLNATLRYRAKKKIMPCKG